MKKRRGPPDLSTQYAPWVISGLGFSEGHWHEGQAKFAFDRRSRGCPGFIKLWQWEREKQCYTIIDAYIFKNAAMKDQRMRERLTRRMDQQP